MDKATTEKFCSMRLEEKEIQYCGICFKEEDAKNGYISHDFQVTLYVMTFYVSIAYQYSD